MNSSLPGIQILRNQTRTPSFTILELLVVISIIVAMMVLVVPALTGRKGAADLTKASYDIAGALEAARAFATANNTYVWVGFFEEDISRGGGVAGTGRLVISTVASKDGTAVFDKEIAMAAVPGSQMLSGTKLIQVGNLKKIDNLHLISNPAAFAGVGQFAARPGAVTSKGDRIGSGNYVSLFNFQYPLSAPYQYAFAGGGSGAAGAGIVQFNPQGEAITDGGPVPGVAPCKEIAIQATHGTVPDQGQNIVAIDIAGMTGVLTIFRK